MSKPTVFIVDDDAAVRASLSLLLETHGLRIATYESGEALLAACDPTWQGCLLLDLRLKGMDGLEVLAQVRRRGATLPAIFLSGHGDIPTTVRAMKAGASEFLTKPVSGEQLIPLVRAALAKDREAQARDQADQALRERLGRLSQREQEVLHLVLAGHGNKDIARILSISHRTVEVHRSRILAKTQAGNMLELAGQISRDELEEPGSGVTRPSA